MKKILTVLMMVVMMAGSLFAYEPKVECATVDKRGNIKYFETYYESCINPNESRYFTIKKNGKFIYFRSGTFESMWDDLERARDGHFLSLHIAKYKDDTCSTCDFLNKYKSAYDNNELNETEMKQYEAIVKLHGSANDVASSIEGRTAHAETGTKSYYELCAKEEKEKAINEIPFVTEENFLTLTKAEMKTKIWAFIEEVKAESK